MDCKITMDNVFEEMSDKIQLLAGTSGSYYFYKKSDSFLNIILINIIMIFGNFGNHYYSKCGNLLKFDFE